MRADKEGDRKKTEKRPAGDTWENREKERKLG